MSELEGLKAPRRRAGNTMSELEGRGAAWTEERGTSDEGRRRLNAPRRRAGNTASTETRQRILDVALACFLSDGYEQTTIARIRERSGTSNGALFHYFPSKEAIAGALYAGAISSFQEGLWALVRRRPRSLRAAVHGAVAHQLHWTEQHADLARFVYLRGHLDWDTPGGAEVASRNRELAAAFRAWMAPLVESGEIRATSIPMISAIVGGPAHAIARRWLAGQIEEPLTSFTGELADAAWAGLRGTRVRARPDRAAQAGARRGRVNIELIGDDGSVIAHGQATAQLVPR
jgi:AcrR family transcriptional regulator